MRHKQGKMGVQDGQFTTRISHVADPSHDRSVSLSTFLTFWANAGRELATAVAAEATQAIIPGSDVPVGISGSLFEAGDLLRVPFQEELHLRLPKARLIPPARTALDGALLMASRSDLPHTELVHHRNSEPA